MFRQRQSVRVDVGDHHMPRAGMFRHRSRHDADGARSSDQHVLPQQVETQRRMHRVAQRVENGADFVRNVIRQRHHVECRQFQILGKGALLVHPDAAGAGVQVELACPALARVGLDQMPLARAALTHHQICNIAPDFDDLARELMAGDHRHRHSVRCPFVPVPDVNIGAANSGLLHLDQHLVGADLRHRRLHHPQTLLRMALFQRLHRVGSAHDTIPSSLPTLPNAASARSSSSGVRAAFICVRMRAWPRGTTGKKKPET